MSSLCCLSVSHRACCSSLKLFAHIRASTGIATMQSHLASTSSRSLINHLLALQQSVHLAGQPQASGRTQSARKPLISSRCVGCGTCQGPTVLHSPTVIQPGQSMCFALPARTWSCACCPSEPALAINPMVDSSAVSLSTDTLVLLEPGVQVSLTEVNTLEKCTLWKWIMVSAPIEPLITNERVWTPTGIGSGARRGQNQL